MTKGVLLIAVGDQAYKGMANNLAASIKYNDPNVKIAIATDEPRLINTSIVYQVIEIPERYYKRNGKNEWIKAKTFMYDLSPFQETIFLDVDMIVLEGRKITPVFDQMKEIDWSIANTGEAGMSIWADISEVKKAYQTDAKFYNFHSEFVYFKKGKETKAYFDLVKRIFDKPKVSGKVFGGAPIADELAFQIASMLTGVYPHQDHFTPTYWWARDRRTSHLYLYQIPQSMISYSIGGNHLPVHVKNNYNNLAIFYYSKLGLQSPYQARDKKLFLKERLKV